MQGVRLIHCKQTEVHCHNQGHLNIMSVTAREVFELLVDQLTS